MAERLEDFLRRILDMQAPPPPPRREPPEPVVEAQVIEVEETPEVERPALSLDEGEGTGDTAEGAVSELLSRAPPVAEHPLGRLDQDGSLTETEVTGQRPAQAALHAADIAQLFRSPQRLREAILLSEILKRPGHG